jgi:hypothetical protein
VTITSPPLAGLLSRAIVVIDPAGNIAYTEQVPEITQEPDYEAALTLLRSLSSKLTQTPPCACKQNCACK